MGDFFFSAVIILWALIILFPIYNLIVVSFSTELAAIRTPVLLFPNPPVLTAYETVFSNDMVTGGLFITFLLIIIGVPYTMFLCSSLAYGLSKKLPGVGFVGFIIVATLYFGGGLIPFYLLMRNLGLINSVFAMILPHGATVFHVIILRNFFQNIPKDIEESAYIDGAKDIRVFAQIIIPMSLPIMVTIGLFVTVQYWNEWWHCLLFINSSNKLSLQYVLRSILIEVNQVRQSVPEDIDLSKIYNEGVKAAVVIITTLPVAVVYPFLQKYFVRGLSSGALKF